jgi:hypothetical protein
MAGFSELFRDSISQKQENLAGKAQANHAFGGCGDYYRASGCWIDDQVGRQHLEFVKLPSHNPTPCEL